MRRDPLTTLTHQSAILQPPDVDRLQEFFRRWLQRHGDKGAVAAVVTWLAQGDLEPSRFHDIVAASGSAHEQWFRDGLLDLVIEYASDRLGETVLTIDDIVDIVLLRRALHVDGSEFIERRPAELSALIQRGLDRALEDATLATSEELSLIAVQAAFDLGFDDFLRLGRASLERAIAFPTFSTLDPDERHRHLTLRQEVWDLYALAKCQERSLGALF